MEMTDKLQTPREVELQRALEMLVMFTKPTPANSASLNNAYRVLLEVKA